ncbi:hypothetical protein NDU88_000334 [Pleurodeles waltl]|uniref:Uncharacterized protein n=1 Tax=Pleurodeles waltl TaxID=8319 RepID=A0AAV7WL29_PLEWA|nr:hypothetical protein NDU88_000334 [Pleurodeles waltl]
MSEIERTRSSQKQALAVNDPRCTAGKCDGASMQEPLRANSPVARYQPKAQLFPGGHHVRWESFPNDANIGVLKPAWSACARRMNKPKGISWVDADGRSILWREGAGARRRMPPTPGSLSVSVNRPHF